ncbi:hypothetical protein IL306_000319 [Fusarium sp. DS 682]|nr:hypothetical protein IL306_000319 [Fusarium sp. DS 682]
MAAERVKASVLHGEKDLRLGANFPHHPVTKSKSPSNQPASAAPIFTTTTTSATATSSSASLSPSATSPLVQS